jgi:hypothetical protein
MQQHDPDEDFLDNDDLPPMSDDDLLDDLEQDELDELDQELVRQVLAPLNGALRGA